jgi:regulation of enolase protein 1 (concanavalin A-like superfamily)
VPRRSFLLLPAALLTLCFAAAALADDTDPEPNPFASGWDRPVDPDKDCKFVRVRGGLTLTVPGKDHDLAAERKLMNSPRLLRDVEGDFVAEVRVGGGFVPSDNSTTNERVPFVGAGLLLMADEKTYVRLERAALRLGGEVKTYANWELRREGKWELAGEFAVCPLKQKVTWLRLQRKGDRLLASASEDGKKWTDLKPLEVKLPAKLKLGVAAGTTSTEAFSPRYDLFKLTRGKRD